MKIVRYLTSEGEVETGGIGPDGGVYPLLESEDGMSLADQPAEVATLLAPLAPPNIFAIGRNYRAHAAETGAEVPTQPLVFSKPTTSVIGPAEEIVIPDGAPDEIDFEAELAIVIGQVARDVAVAEALDYVFGYTCANDVSARDCQRNDKQWTRAKGFDTFCPLGPCIVTPDEFDPAGKRIRSIVNGEPMQDASTDEMIFGPALLISFLSHQFTLLPGTVILTGTPSGVGMARKPPRYLKPGDEIQIEIDGLGRLTNRVISAAEQRAASGRT